MRRIPYCTALVSAFTLLAHLLPGWTQAMEFNRAGLAAGEFWRLLSGHLTHFGFDHLRWDLAVFLAMGSLVEFRSRRGFVLCSGAGALFVSLAVWWVQPQFFTYRGLSGIDSALFVYVAVDIMMLALAERNGWVILAAVAGLCAFGAKVVFELVSGATVFVDQEAGFAPVPMAHLVGAVVGGCVSARSNLSMWVRRAWPGLFRPASVTLRERQAAPSGPQAGP